MHYSGIKAPENLRWYFPEDTTIRELGANSLKFDTSDDAVKMFVRELCQNSCDASAGGTVRIEFELFRMPRSDFPDADGFEKVLWRCEEAASRLENDRSSQSLLEDMCTSFQEPAFDVLRISDFGTTGARGSDINDPEIPSPWRTMTITQGISNKSGKAAGSFGRGKDSFFMVSKFHSIFFVTNADDGLCASIGCSDLITHFDENKMKYASFGVYGNPAFKKNYSFPGMVSFGDYRRPQNELGTDVYIIGYSHASDKWEYGVLSAIVRDFFVKIYRNELVVKVGNISLNADNLVDTIKVLEDTFAYEANDLGTVLEQVKLLSDRPFRRTDRYSLYLQKSDRYNQISTVRGGMLIDRFYKKPQGAIGLLIIDDDNTSRLLAKSEPSNHDKWSKSNLQNVGSAMKKQITHLLTEIGDFVACAVRDFNGNDEDEQVNAEGLDKYISLHTETDEEIQVARKEFYWGSIATVKTRRKNKVKKHKENTDDIKTNPVEMMASEDDTKPDSDPNSALDRKDKDRGEEPRDFHPDENGDMKRMFKISSAIKITDVAESCRRNQDSVGCTFVFSINSNEEYYVRVSAIMRGGKSAEQVPLLKVTDSEGNAIPIIDDYFAGPIRSVKGKRNRLEIVLNYPAICDFRPEVVDRAD